MDSVNLAILGNNLREPRFFIFKFLIIWLALFFDSILIYSFFEIFLQFFNPITIFIVLPFLMIIWFGGFLIVLFLIGKLYLVILNLAHKPKEGIFFISLKDRDYLFYCIRKTIKELILKLCDYFPLPWIKILPIRIFNIKIPANVGILDSYIDAEFIEFGDEVILGEGSIILSSIIIGNYLLVKKTIIKDRVTIGAYSIVSPGTFAEEGSILGMGCFTKINQHLYPNAIYVGRPAKKLRKD